jgi:DNA-binding MarR family transcriptional regulator
MRKSPTGRTPSSRSAQDPATVESVRRSLVALRRLFQRKELAQLWASAFGRRSELDYSDLRLLDAVGVSSSEHGATVGEISRLLGVDPSRASRHVARAVRNGLLRRAVAQDDGRKVVLQVTAKGKQLQAKGSELTRARIGLALGGWRDAQQAEFAAQLARFVERIVA